MNCDYEGCDKEGCATTSEWLNDGAMIVKYWCKDHALAKADWFCLIKAISNGKCKFCALSASDCIGEK